MLKKILFGFIFFTLSATGVSAHTLILDVYSDIDDTITIRGKFDTGASAAGALVILESSNTGEVLFEERLPLESEITVEIPDEPYRIILDGGPGHRKTKQGIPPKNGFTVAPEEEKDQTTTGGINVPLIVCLGLGFCLLSLTLFISIKNTNKILKAMSKDPD